MKLAELGDDTLVYPGHDYTEENYEFGLTIEPGNKSMQKLLEEVRRKQKGGEATAPSTIGQEKEVNVFLRAGSVAIKAAVGMANAGGGEVFAELRRRKNIFG